MSESFSDKVKFIVQAIPAGSVKSYQEVAAAAGNPKAARAVAMIMSKNFDPTIPCHRVVRSDGTLGGYNRGGETAKRDRLYAEGAIV